jgi:predicted RNA-binding protein with TRAM domain
MYNKDRGSDRGFGGGQNRSFAPIQVGQELDVKIEAVGEKGDGIAKVKGFVIFVPNTKAGEDVKIRITKVSKKVGFGEVIGGSTDRSQDEGSEEYSEESEDESESEPVSKSDEDFESEDTEEAEEDSESFGEADEE